MAVRSKISDNFTLAEFTVSQTAVRHGIYNFPNATQFREMEALCMKVLEPLRYELRLRFSPHATVHVSSGFRCVALNRAVGGAPNSQHCRGQAADITVPGMTVQDLFVFVIESGLVFDQAINEFSSWLHISFKRSGKNRRQALYAQHDRNGNVIYVPYKPAEVLKMGETQFYGSKFV